MKNYKSPCVAVLGSVADATAAEYPHGVGICVTTDRESCSAELRIYLPNDVVALGHLQGPEAIDEVVRDLLAAKADLLKLMHKGPP